MASTLMPAAARAALASSDALVGSSGTVSSYAYAGAALAVHCASRPASGFAHIGEITDDRKVTSVLREQGHVVDVGGSCDREIDCAAARLSAPSLHRGGQAPPLSRDHGGDG